MILKTLSALIYLEDNLYVVECPEVETVSQESTIEEINANLKEASKLYLEEFPTESTSRPILTTFKVKVHV